MEAPSPAGHDEDGSNATPDIGDDDRQRLAAFLRCAVCGDLADDAVDTLCCRALVCSVCLRDRLGRACPICHRGCSEVPNHLARRIVGCQPWRCPHCGVGTARSEAADHGRVCPRRTRACPAPDCKFSGPPDAYLDHLVAGHGPQLLRRAGRLFGGSGPARGACARVTQHAASVTWISEPGYMNRSRTFAAVTGKTYCGGPLNGAHCDCCDGNCGPSNGCNCADCMRRDLAAFGVSGPGQRALVNREGVIARQSRATGRFYCGRQNMLHDRSTEGFCGPQDGNNCHACRQLDVQARDRYASIVTTWTD